MNIELTEKEAKVVIYALRAYTLRVYSDKVVPYTDCREVERRIVSQYREGMTNPR